MNNRQFFGLRGFMKSGTNWVAGLLNTHDEISCVGEFHWQELVVQFNENLNTLPLYESEMCKEQARFRFEEMIKNFLIDFADPSATLIGDRTPAALLPITLRNVPHISVLRDGRDVLVSRAFHLYNRPDVSRLFDRIPAMAETYAEFQKDPWFFKKNPMELLCHEVMVRESVGWWRDHLNSDQAAVRRFPNLKVCFVKYEDFHRDTLGEREKLFEFLGVDPARSAAIDGALKPGFGEERPSEFLRKGSVGDWRNYFSEDTKSWFKEEAGQTLIEYDYVDSMDW